MDCDEFLGDCLGECCCCMCQLCVETDCCGACSRSTNCCVVTAALSTVAVATLVAVLVLAYAGVFPARVSVEDASLGRLALANGTAALAYHVSLAIAVRDRNFATGVWRAAPLHAELRFRGQTFARASAQLESAEWGLFPARGQGLYRVTAASDSGGAPVAVALGGDGVAEFVRESVAGVFELELAVVAGGSSVSATCMHICIHRSTSIDDRDGQARSE